MVLIDVRGLEGVRREIAGLRETLRALVFACEQRDRVAREPAGVHGAAIDYRNAMAAARQALAREPLAP